ncbi:MAG: type 4a pilus biogenesis protein PilO [Deltaproteobacteria bacterium]|nr:type 4a pilus biogenesis protein PilO [Deltaproteobacteria bacterium]
MADLNFDFLHSYSNGKKALILGGIIALLGILFVYFLYLPKHNENQKLSRNLKQAQVKLQQTRQIAAQLPELEAEFEKLELAFKKALNKLPDDKEIPALLLKISKLGKDAKLDFNLFQPLATRNRDFYAEVPIDVEVSGSYHAVGRFFSQICAMPRIVNIRDFSLGDYSSKGEEEILKTRFQAVTYTFTDQKLAPPPDTGKQKKKR